MGDYILELNALNFGIPMLLLFFIFLLMAPFIVEFIYKKIHGSQLEGKHNA